MDSIHDVPSLCICFSELLALVVHPPIYAIMLLSAVLSVVFYLWSSQRIQDKEGVQPGHLDCLPQVRGFRTGKNTIHQVFTVSNLSRISRRQILLVGGQTRVDLATLAFFPSFIGFFGPVNGVNLIKTL